MTPKDLLLQELDDVPEPLLIEVLDFLLFLKARQDEDTADIQDARNALLTIALEGTVTWESLKSDVGL